MDKSRMIFRRFPSVLAALSALVFLIGCATVPETGRRQLLLVSPGEEMSLGLTEFQKMKRNLPVSASPAENALVQKVGRRIAAVAPLPNAQWEFVVFDDPKTANAFCLPGGKVGVYTGLLPITKDEDGLATVIGHEVSHAVARHGAERISEGLLIQFGGEILDAATSKKTDATRALAAGAFGVFSQVGVALPHSRSQESEADHLGLIYMARAGYDPRQAVEFWKRFADYNAKSGNHPIQFLSTHPVDAVRIRQLENELPQAISEFEKTSREKR